MSKFQAHKDAPDAVWLQIGYGDEGTHTWAAHQVAEDDIEQAGPYVRADRLSGRVTVTDAMVSAAMPAYNLTGPEYHIAPRTSEDHVRFILQAGFAALDPAQIRREDPFFALVFGGISEAAKAMLEFPQPNYVISKVAEEAGEVVKAAIHHAEGRETAESVKAEMRQLIAMLFRLYIEGDQVHGMAPLITGGDDDTG